MSGHVASVRLYVTIFLALMVLTAATVGVALVDLGDGNIMVALVIAAFKASLVVLFFMHVKYSSKLVQVTVVSGFSFMALMFILTMTDILSRNILGPGK